MEIIQHIIGACVLVTDRLIVGFRLSAQVASLVRHMPFSGGRFSGCRPHSNENRTAVAGLLAPYTRLKHCTCSSSSGKNTNPHFDIELPKPLASRAISLRGKARRTVKRN